MKVDTWQKFSHMEERELLDFFGVKEGGLHAEQVTALRERFGANTFSSQRKPSLWEEAKKAYFTPFSLVLLFLSGVTFFTDYVWAKVGEQDLSSSLVILLILFLSGTISFVQSRRSSNATEALEKMVHVTASVLRDGVFQERPTEELVCGDRVQLAAGDIIPADLRLLQTKDLFLSEAALTGESYPVEKFAHPASAQEAKMGKTAQNIAFMGSNIVSGAGIGLVIKTGESTEFGDIASRLSGHAQPTAFDIGLDQTSKLLVRFMALLVPAVFLINGFFKGNWSDSFVFAVSVAVGLTPQLLPMVVTTNLVKGADTLAKRGTIVRNLNAIQNFGAMDVLCTDKTGTLTQDRIVLERHLDCNGKEEARILRHAYLNAYYQTGLKNLMDKAIIQAAREELDLEEDAYEKVDEIPFDFERRRMSVVVRDVSGKTQLITKGAIEEMLEVSAYVDLGGEIQPLDASMRQRVLQQVRALNEDGMRVLGVAQKTNPPAETEFRVADESEMVLIGYLAFLDPPKDSAREALAALRAHAVDVKVITGDNLEVTRTVCRQVGIDTQHILSGDMLASYPQEAWAKAVEDHNVFVKVSPAQKADIVAQLQKNGHVVGFLGDGINDSPALIQADIGISVDTAVDIAKESADIILLKKDLMVLERGVLSGREIFGNIMKYLKISISSNFGNVFSILLASIFLPFLPMLPTQLLVLNLIYDISCMSIPWDHMDPEYLAKPKTWDASDLRNFMFYFGPVSSIFDCLTFVVLYFFLCPAILGATFPAVAGTGAEPIFESLFHTGWFVVSLWTQTFVLWSLRTEKIPFLQSRPSFVMMTITTLGVVAGTILPYTPLGGNFKLMPLPSFYYGLLVAVLVGYFFLVSRMKPRYCRKHGKLL